MHKITLIPLIFVAAAPIVAAKTLDNPSPVIATQTIDTPSPIAHNAPQAATPELQEHDGSVGVGFGLPYGLIGLGLDINLANNLYATIGLGTTGDSVAYNAGLKYYFRDVSKVWRPRLTFLYGTNGFLERECFGYGCNFNSEIETFKGTTVGLGQSFSFGHKRKHGFDLDLLYRLSDGGFEDETDRLENNGYTVEQSSSNGFSLAIGYRYNF